ncbi:MAG: class I SAM-dependent methyltransferase [Rhodoferax sp.]
MSAACNANQRACPVCQTDHHLARLYLEDNIDPEKLSSYSFASRKTPEFMTHRLVQCPECDLVYVSQPPAEDELLNAYHVAAYDSADEANDAASAYMQAMYAFLQNIGNKQRALEIGAGTGIFLELLQNAGFHEVIGVEPSKAAIAAAAPYRRAWILEGKFDERDFESQSFDLICCFMTLEHVRDPKLLADAAFRLLRPGGAFITVTHNYRSIVNRLLGRRSPIIDIEHMQLFSDKSMYYLFGVAGFESVVTKTFVNTYTVSYWLRLTPLPLRAKSLVARIIRRLHWERWKLGLNVGNAITVGFKPAECN